MNQESIPVGCVPTAEVASTMGGGSRVYPALGYPTLCFPDTPLDTQPTPDTLPPPRKDMRPKIAYPPKGTGTRDTLPPTWTDTCENITFPQLRLRLVNITLPAVNLGCRPRVPAAAVEPSWLCRTAILLVLLDMILKNLPAMNLEHTLCPLSCKNVSFTFGVNVCGGGGGVEAKVPWPLS